jgi:hypothetical protein
MPASLKALVVVLILAVYLLVIEVYSHVIARRFGPALRSTQG